MNQQPPGGNRKVNDRNEVPAKDGRRKPAQSRRKGGDSRNSSPRGTENLVRTAMVGQVEEDAGDSGRHHRRCDDGKHGLVFPSANLKKASRLVDRVLVPRIGLLLKIALINVAILLVGWATYYGWAKSLDMSPPETYTVKRIVPPSAKSGGKVTVYASVVDKLDRECSADTVAWFVDSKGVEHYVGRDYVSGYARSAIFREGFDGPELSFDLMIPLLSSQGEGEYVRITRYRCEGYPGFLDPIEGRWSATVNVL